MTEREIALYIMKYLASLIVWMDTNDCVLTYISILILLFERTVSERQVQLSNDILVPAILANTIN